jgi:acetyltransferase
MTAIANAGIISLSNPLDMGDFYRIDQYPFVFSRVLASDQVDGAIYASQWPRMPADGDDVFTAMFNTDIYTPAATAGREAKKPLALALFGHGPAIAAMKARLPVPLFDGPEEAIIALKRQMVFHARKASGAFVATPADGIDRERARAWVRDHNGHLGEGALELLACYGIPGPRSLPARSGEEAGAIAETLGYPLVMKVISPQALHKTEAGGVITGIRSRAEAEGAYAQIAANLARYRHDAVFHGVRVCAMADHGHDLFIGGLQDPAFGPVVFFGYGGIHVEVFRDIERALCPASLDEIRTKIRRLRSFAILAGTRGGPVVDPEPFVRAVLLVSHLLTDFSAITELDLNPVRMLERGGILALDARLTIGKG